MFGSKEAFVNKLDTLFFVDAGKLPGSDVIPDVTGLIGLYAHVEKPYAPYYTEEEIAAKTDGTDWVGAVTRTGEQQSHNVSLRGGTEKTNYMASVNYIYQNGIVKNNDMNRITGLFNLDQTISSIFKTGFSLNVSHNKYDNVELGNGEDELSGIIASAAGFDPCLPIYDENGNYTINPYISFVPNPVSLLNIKDKTVKDRILASAYLQAEPIKGLVLKVNVGVDRRNQTRKNYIPKTTLVGQNVNGEANIYQNESTDYLMDLTANYNKTLGANNINALLGYSYQEFNNEGFNAGNEGFLTDEFLYYNIGAGQYSKPCQKEVESMSTDEVKQVRTFKGNKLVFLQELVDYLADKDSMYVEFEMKTNDPIKYYPTDKLRDYCDKLYKTTMAKKPAHSLYLFTSGDKAALNMMRFLHPNAELLYISGKPINEETILTAIDMGIKRLGCSLQGTSKQMVDLAHKAGISVSLWPNASREDIMLGVYLGADALCCDRALEIKKFLDTKAPWIKYK